jgi:hypothetical protein
MSRTVRVSIFTTLCLVLFLVPACRKNRFKINPEKISLTLSYRHLEWDLFPPGTRNPDAVLADIQKKYPDFYRDYFAGVLRLGNPDDPEFNVPLAGFLNDVYIKQLADEAALVYGKTDDLEKTLTDAFRRYHHFLPEATIPKVVFCITALNYAVVATDSVMAIGLDMFLGGDFEPYRALGYPDYLCNRKDKAHMIPEVLTGWLMSEFPKDINKLSMIDHMVYKGKIAFMVQVMLPDVSDEFLFGFTKEQVEFIAANEAQIWGNLIEKKLLFTEDKKEIQKIMEEAPFAAGMPREVPGRIGVWVGRNIVKSYLEKNENVSLENLMNNEDYKTIFTRSGYKPKYK